MQWLHVPYCKSQSLKLLQGVQCRSRLLSETEVSHQVQILMICTTIKAVPHVFQELQSPQRPFHWLNSPPHSVHLKTVDFFAAAAAE